MSNNSMLEERWYLAQQLLPGSILCCKHGPSPICRCVRYFNINKKHPMSERYVTITAATFELTRMERLNIQNDEKYKLLCALVQCDKNEVDLCIEAYERIYGPLPPKRTIEVLEPVQQIASLESDPVQQVPSLESDQDSLTTKNHSLPSMNWLCQRNVFRMLPAILVFIIMSFAVVLPIIN